MRECLRVMLSEGDSGYGESIMSKQKQCPECGSEKIRVLTPMTGTDSAYLCENGHFFLDLPDADCVSLQTSGSRDRHAS